MHGDDLIARPEHRAYAGEFGRLHLHEPAKQLHGPPYVEGIRRARPSILLALPFEHLFQRTAVCLMQSEAQFTDLARHLARLPGKLRRRAA